MSERSHNTKQVTVDKVVYRVGDSCAFCGDNDTEWLGQIAGLRCTKLPTGRIQRIVKVKWYYRKADIDGKHLARLESGLRASVRNDEIFASEHCDTNHVECVLGKVSVLRLCEGAALPQKVRPVFLVPHALRRRGRDTARGAPDSCAVVRRAVPA